MSAQGTSKVEAILYAVAALAGSIAILFFGFNVQFPISPATKFVMLAVIGLWLFVAGQFAETQTGVITSYVLGIVSGCAGIVKLIQLLSLGDIGIVLLFTAIAVLFVGLARWVRIGKVQPLRDDTRMNALLAGAGLLLVVTIVLLDVLTGGVMFTLTAVETTEATPDREEPIVRVATVEQTNTGLLPYETTAPRYEACFAGNWPNVPADDRERFLRLSDRGSSSTDRLVNGGGRVTSDLYAFSPRTEDGERVDLTDIPVVRADSCPGTTDGEKRIVIYQTEAGGIRPV